MNPSIFLKIWNCYIFAILLNILLHMFLFLLTRMALHYDKFIIYILFTSRVSLYRNSVTYWYQNSTFKSYHKPEWIWTIAKVSFFLMKFLWNIFCWKNFRSSTLLIKHLLQFLVFSQLLSKSVQIHPAVQIHPSLQYNIYELHFYLKFGVECNCIPYCLF